MENGKYVQYYSTFQKKKKKSSMLNNMQHIENIFLIILENCTIVYPHTNINYYGQINASSFGQEPGEQLHKCQKVYGDFTCMQFLFFAPYFQSLQKKKKKITWHVEKVY